ncbi:PREDICTED: Golgi to ER traffic protein 4 homolog [Tarenaya hassleriana]|uniref:Golgi to ER traffic protein 4 homolog n=1 Tax=Tarenaya hassleriana TaxID=28532 RepID=UPI00053C0922|nr:PREDICTED: Golgi to ER traffic protein 4 homolog [Tarenaya hassleriana]XP_010520116.1 PREDICTED: Golgi to ER traffic protein 4 homolog [Tarenaya hassleriana]XP_010520117.1 PREDICTED: Golgi to ER traffic protein 4 homolog [Tarenaya hassleriana]
MSRERIKRELPPAQEHIEKLQKVVDGGNYYGALQMYKSISARYVSAQRFSEALDILFSGACLQLEHGQVNCGADLALLFVDTLVKATTPCNDETLDRIRCMYKLFPRVHVPPHLVDVSDDESVQKLQEALGEARARVESVSSFLRAAIKWSSEFGGPSTGVPELHVMLADYLYTESPELDMVRISRHFVRGEDPTKFASTLVNFMGKCYPGEDDLAIARAVLMYLAQGNMRDANFVMDEIKKQAESGQHHELPESDLIQFISYLLQTLQRDALPLFNMLRTKFKSSIDREPLLNELLDEIGERFYGVQRRNPLQGMFGDIFKMMG